jgi:hypothetical protein
MSFMLNLFHDAELEAHMLGSGALAGAELAAQLVGGAPLARADGDAGHPDQATPFPKHFTVTY